MSKRDKEFHFSPDDDSLQQRQEREESSDNLRRSRRLYATEADYDYAKERA
jgi:hypothetical protein